MTYATEQITQTLKRARETRAFSQRALSAKAGVPQSHISKIENGAVDLRVSSLTELAHVLGLEVMLVPRKSVSAVQAIVRSTEGAPDPGAHSASRDLSRLQRSVSRQLQANPTLTELAELQRHTHELAKFTLQESNLNVIRTVTDRIEQIVNAPVNLAALFTALEQIRHLRNTLVHEAAQKRTAETVQPAYSLDEDDDD